MHKFTAVICLLLSIQSFANHSYWQQQVHYTMNVELNVETHQLRGTQKLVYTNHSPDTLRKVFYHLYFNAFQPGSMMDVRSRTIADPDRRVGSRIYALKEDETGWQRILSLTQNGKPTSYNTVGTVLEVLLPEPILPGTQAVFDMSFEAQVPVQIRRSGRNNKEDIDYTMTQWYPKMAAYDRDGWHPDQYVGREFYAPFGTFDVKITLPKQYVLGGTGVIQNPDEVGHGYATAKPSKPAKTPHLTWHFIAEHVHDFAWAADPEFIHRQFTLSSGIDIHLLYHKKTAFQENWEKAAPDIEKFFAFMNDRFGPYAYPQFSLIQGGDGGMEYPMCTMMLGSGKDYKGFFGLFAHEAAHNWFYGMLATNEQRYAWMDEGFTNFADTEAMNHIFNEGKINPHVDYFKGYKQLDSLGLLVPMTTPSDRFDYNYQYSMGSYGMGQLMLMQLQYILGEEVFWKGMKVYYRRWIFKHPRPEDFIKVMEDVSGLQLDWFLVYWTQLTHTADYAVKEVRPNGPSGSRIILEKKGKRPMPVDVKITLTTGEEMYYTIPLIEMYGAKEDGLYQAQPAWRWTDHEYTLEIMVPFGMVKSVVADPLQRSCDIKPVNNTWQAK